MAGNPYRKDIPENVVELLEKSSHIVAKHEEETFFDSTYCDLTDCESPIEQIFLIAFKTMATINDFKPQYFDVKRDIWIEAGVSIVTQARIGDYRVDFLLQYSGPAAVVDAEHKTTISEQEQRCIVVELDGHRFHERDERQRRYEKRRDRTLQKLGYKVFHYTGSELFKAPFKVAAECLSFLTGVPQEDLEQGE